MTETKDIAATDLWSVVIQRPWLDLSLTISEKHPTWPAHMPFQRKVWNWFGEPTLPGQASRTAIPYHTAWWSIDEHTGTHFDAPTHFIPPEGSGFDWAGPAGNVSGERVLLSKLRGPARVFDVSNLLGKAPPGVSPAITVDAMEQHERQYGPLTPGDVVIFASGWDRNYHEGPAGSAYALDVVQGRTPGWPSPTPELIERLYEKGITTLATDGCSIGSAQDGVPEHRVGLSREMAYVEGLAHLDRLPPTGAYFIFLPVKVAGSSGAPGRAVAILPEAR
jgi:kynurenine formamidase